MQCQALTKKGLQCTHKATYPPENPLTCKIWAHMKQIPGLAPGEVKTKVIQTGKKIIVKAKQPVKEPSKAKSYLDKTSLDKLFSKDEAQLDTFLERKQEIISVLNDLYTKGLNLKKGDSMAIEYLKSRFTKDIIKVNLKILQESLALLEAYQNRLIILLTKYDLDKEYAVLKTDFLRYQLGRTIDLIETLKNLHSNPKGGQALIEFLKEYEMEELEKEGLLTATPIAPTVPVYVPAYDLPINAKQAVKLLKK